jgi:hypothetical protein
VAPGFSVGASFSSGGYGGPFVYVSAGHFCDPRVRRYVVPDVEARTIVNRTRIVNNLTIENNIVVNRGPDPRAIERASGRHIQTVTIESVPRSAPGGHFDRATLAVESRRSPHGFRAAEPVSERQPLPQSRAHGHVNEHPRGTNMAAPSPRPEPNRAAPHHDQAQRPTAHPAPAHVAPAHPAPEHVSPAHSAPPHAAPAAQHHASQPDPKTSQGGPGKPGKPPHDDKPHGG